MNLALRVEGRSRRPLATGGKIEPFPIDPRMLDELLDCSADSISVIGPNGEARFVNTRGLEHVAIASQAMVTGQAWLDQWPDACGEELTVAIELARSGQRARCDVRCENDRGERSWWEVSFSPWQGDSNSDRAALVIGVARDVTDRHNAIADAQLLAQEAHHRSCNMLSMVQAIVRISAGASRNAAHFIGSVETRIDALARSHALMTKDRHGEVGLRDLIGNELAPFDESGRVALDGPAVSVPGPTASALSLAIHELTSNAVKYGALSVRAGRLAVSWRIDATDRMQILWSEIGRRGLLRGRAGFGSMLLEDLLSDQLIIDRKWRDDGVTATIEFVAQSRSGGSPD